MSSKIVFRIDNNGCVGEGSVSKQEEGFMITYMTFDGYVDDGYFNNQEAAEFALSQAIRDAVNTAERYGKLAEANGGMY